MVAVAFTAVVVTDVPGIAELRRRAFASMEAVSRLPRDEFLTTLRREGMTTDLNSLQLSSVVSFVNPHCEAPRGSVAGCEGGGIASELRALTLTALDVAYKLCNACELFGLVEALRTYVPVEDAVVDYFFPRSLAGFFEVPVCVLACFHPAERTIKHGWCCTVEIVCWQLRVIRLSVTSG